MTTSTVQNHSSSTSSDSKTSDSEKQEQTQVQKGVKAGNSSNQSDHPLLKYFTEHHNVSLGVCFAGIITFYTYYSYLQEYLIADKSKKLNVNVVMGFQNVIALAISTIILKAAYKANLVDCLTKNDFIIGFLTFGSMFCSNFALKFVNYPFVVLSKSAKIMPVIVVGSIRKIYTLHKIQYVLATLITVGLILFNSKKLQNLEYDNIIGIILVLSSLMFDGLTSSQTDKEHKNSGRDYAYAIMFSNNLVQIVGNLLFYSAGLIYQSDDTIARLFNFNDLTLLRDVVMIGLSGALGQIFIYFAISLFNCYILTIITTSRKLFSVVLSNVAFQHHFSFQQWIGAAIVMLCTFVELFIGKRNKDKEYEAKKNGSNTKKYS